MNEQLLPEIPDETKTDLVTEADRAAAPLAPHESGYRSRIFRRSIRLGFVILGLVLVGAAVYLELRAFTRDHEMRGRSTLRAERGELIGTSDVAELRYIDVVVATLSEGIALLPAPGRVTVADSHSTRVAAPLPGRIEHVNVELGDKVRPGDPLVAVRSVHLPGMISEIEIVKSRLAVKRTSAARLRDLVALRAVPEKDLLLVESEVRQMEIELRSAEAKRRSLRLDRVEPEGLYWIPAPRAGVVVVRHVLVGMEVGPGRTESLLSIAQLDEVDVMADLLESD